MGVLHTIVDRAGFEKAVMDLWAEGYDRLAIFWPGSDEHKRRGLDKDHFLIRAWKTRREAGRREA